MQQVNSVLFLSVLLCLSLVTACTDEPQMMSGDGDASPNVVLIIVDDMGWDVFGNYPGADGMKANTPTLDSLASNGISFLNFWTNPICAPTRASILTGKYAFRNGVGGVQTPQQQTLSSDETIIQKYITDNSTDSYASALIGKWHVSSTSDLTAPEDLGIDYYSGIFLGAVPDYYNWTQTSAGAQETVTTYATSHFVDQSVSWIESQSQPFFLWLAFNAPHTPFHRPPLSLISDQSLTDVPAAIEADPFPYYLAAIEVMDTEVARLISSMSVEQRENTVFIVMGDNGTPRQVSQAPYIGNRVKSTLFQGGVNCPLIISGKGVTRRNETETALVHTPDLFASIADLTVGDVTSYEDGVSIKPLLTDASGARRSFIYTEQFGSTNTTNDGYAIRNEEYKLIHLADGTEYYYLIATDPFENTNLLNGDLTAEAAANLEELNNVKADL